MESTESGDAEKIRSLEQSAIDDVLNDHEFPITTEEVIEQYGDLEIDYQHGVETLGSILQTSGMETYETGDEIELAILNGVSRDAVGRPRYSDRSDERDVELDRGHRSL